MLMSKWKACERLELRDMNFECYQRLDIMGDNIVLHWVVGCSSVARLAETMVQHGLWLCSIGATLLVVK